MFEAKGIVCFTRAFDGFCYKHRPKQDLSQFLISYDEEPPTCCVCLFSIAQESSFSGSDGGVVSECDRSLAALNISESSKSGFLCSRRRPSQWRSNSKTTPNPVASIPPAIRHLKWLRSYLKKYLASSGVSAFDAWSHGVIHGGCCRPSWMHRECIAGYARSAGLHHLKCPLCFDERIFIPTVIRFGVWVPDRDASWELEPSPSPGSSLAVEVAIPSQDSRVETSFLHTEVFQLGHMADATSHHRSRRHTVMPSHSGLRSLRSHNRNRQSLRQRSTVTPHVSKKPSLFGVNEDDDENKENIDPVYIVPH